MTSSSSKYFFAIDFLRGFAAVIVLIYHYQHFYFPEAGISITSQDELRLPFFRELYYVHMKGYYGVQLFWIISGVVFAARYLEGRFDGLADFLVRRFARLYPLHFGTLILVAVLQAISWYNFDHFQIFEHNDAYHFFLQIFLASNWGFEKGFSFNSPIWSVSVEIIAYALFVIAIPLLKRHWWSSVLLMTAGGLVYQFSGHNLVAQCIFYFFTGTFVFQMMKQLSVRKSLMLISVPALVSALLLSQRTNELAFFFLSFSLVFSALAIDKAGWGKVFGKMKWLGDASYSIYLLHVPIQIVALILFESGTINQKAADSVYFFTAFIVGTIGISWVVHRLFEHPLRRYIVGRFATH